MSDPVNASIVDHFQALEDPRIERTKKHHLLDILVIALCTLLTGGDGFQDMALFGKSKHAWLQTFLALPHGIPSHDTFGRVFARLNPRRFQECFLSWTQAVARLTQGTLVSLDGKTVKASFDRATAASPLHMLSAWCSDNGGLVIGQTRTDSKSNEITAIPDLLQLLAIQGCIVTIDAMGCQTAIAAQIQDQGGDYLLALKANHKKAYKAIKAHFHQEIEHNLAWRNDENFFDAFDPTFKGSECPCRFFGLRALHTTKSRGPVRHRPADAGVEHQRAARPLAHLSIIGPVPLMQTRPIPPPPLGLLSGLCCLGSAGHVYVGPDGPVSGSRCRRASPAPSAWLTLRSVRASPATRERSPQAS